MNSHDPNYLSTMINILGGKQIDPDDVLGALLKQLDILNERVSRLEREMSVIKQSSPKGYGAIHHIDIKPSVDIEQFKKEFGRQTGEIIIYTGEPSPGGNSGTLTIKMLETLVKNANKEFQEHLNKVEVKAEEAQPSPSSFVLKI